MVRTSAKVLLMDAVLIVAGYLVFQDLTWRSAYAASEGLVPSYAYSLFTRYFTMTGRALALQSPPELDWVQVLVGLFVLINAWYIYAWATKKGVVPANAQPVAAS